YLRVLHSFPTRRSSDLERRIPSFSVLYLDPLFQNWARTIGELARVSPVNPIWLRWTGYLLFVTPFLVWIGVTKRKRTTPVFILRSEEHTSELQSRFDLV